MVIAAREFQRRTTIGGTTVTIVVVTRQTSVFCLRRNAARAPCAVFVTCLDSRSTTANVTGIGATPLFIQATFCASSNGARPSNSAKPSNGARSAILDAIITTTRGFYVAGRRTTHF
jgi:hypothetical protein